MAVFVRNVKMMMLIMIIIIMIIIIIITIIIIIIIIIDDSFGPEVITWFLKDTYFQNIIHVYH